jgi:hypothetical protein
MAGSDQQRGINENLRERNEFYGEVSGGIHHPTGLNVNGAAKGSSAGLATLGFYGFVAIALWRQQIESWLLFIIVLASTTVTLFAVFRMSATRRIHAPNSNGRNQSSTQSGVDGAGP